MTYISFAWLIYPDLFGKTIFPIAAEFIYDNKVLLGLGFALYLLSVVLIVRYREKLYFNPEIQKILSVFCATLLCLNLPTLYKLARYDQGEIVQFQDVENTLADQKLATAPHIIYIVPDRYTSNQNLRDIYRFDNSDFAKALEKRGFYIWDNQVANYTKTFQSVASTQNMNYLNSITDKLGSEQNYSPVFALMRNTQTERILKSKGYELTNFGNWWDPTRYSDNADYTLSAETGLNEFSYKFFEITPLAVLKEGVTNQVMCKLVEDQKQEIIKTVKREKPQFVFWHNVITHPPFPYNDDGSCANRAFANFKNETEFSNVYLKHIGHFNNFVLPLIDEIRKQSERPVIFVIQSDEGPYPWAYMNNLEGYDFFKAPSDEIKKKYGVMNAIYLPSGNYEDFGKYKTPINNVRFIFDEIFKTELPKLMDKSYTLHTDNAPYDLKDISTELYSD